MSIKKYLLLTVVWIGMILTIFYQTKAASHRLAVIFCDVGQGDAILLIDGDFQILIDGGPDEQVLSCLRQELPLTDRTLERVILTHADSDHFAGLTSVFSTYDVEELWLHNLPKASVDYYRFYEQVQTQLQRGLLKIRDLEFAQNGCETKNLCWQVLTTNDHFLPEDFWVQKLTFSDLSDMLKKSIPNNINYNDESIAFNFIIVDKKLTLTGDIEKNSELAMVASGLLTKVDWLKIAHHGSKTSSTPEILEILQPEISLISCGLGNSFGHPHPQTLERLKTLTGLTMRTDQLGTIEFTYQAGQWHYHSRGKND